MSCNYILTYLSFLSDCAGGTTCACDLSLHTAEGEHQNLNGIPEFNKPVIVGKDKPPKIELRIKNTGREYAYGYQLKIKSEIELQEQFYQISECSAGIKVIYNVTLYYFHSRSK